MKTFFEFIEYIILTSIFIFGLCGCSPVGDDTSNNIISIVAVGDVNFGSDYPYNAVPSRDKKNLFDACRKIIMSADISFCNLETALCNGGKPAKKYGRKGVFLFRAPCEFSEILAETGFDVVSVANNHIRDFGFDGEQQTKRSLKENNIQYLSIDGETAEFQIRETKIIFVGFSAGLRKRSIINPESVFNEIKLLSDKSDILVVSFHAGAEGEDAIHTKNRTESYLGENRGNPVFLAHGAIDNGADLVLMHGPHVPRGVEVYRERFIAYSLGNFLNYGWKLNRYSKIAPLLWINLYPDGKPASVIIYSFIQNRPGFPEFDRQNQAYKLIKDLTQKDISTGGFQFSDQ
ncbi:MAG TPA: CapA family protein [Candidatus Ratteibacteria bacterium]|nr:CapA family protein [Candidatus Ratteibacteria bacterium]